MPDEATLNAVLNTYGVDANSISIGGGSNFLINLFLGIIFGIFGMYAFNNGRKEKNYKYLGLGIALMAYPYFVMNNTWLIAGIGIALTAALFLWKD